jgi:hypothetical protein
MNFTEDEKWAIWMDYMVTQVALNNVPLEYVINPDRPYQQRVGDKGVKVYPIMGIFTLEPQWKHPVRDFDGFCNDPDALNSNTLRGWYWRFKDRIQKNNEKIFGNQKKV